MPGPYVYSKVDGLEDTALAGGGSCVRLLQVHAGVPHTSTWKQGAAVRGNTTIAKGTAIATFVNGKYPNQPTGNHAAFYISQDASGIYVMDQWKGKAAVGSRPLPFLGKDRNGRYIRTSNNGDAFSIIL